MDKLKTGDVVKLPSGGPLMTVDGFRPESGKVCCAWFCGDQLQRSEFFVEAVVKSEGGSGPATASAQGTPPP